MKISKVEAIPFAIPYRKALRFASGSISNAEHVLIRVQTDDGLVGHAEATLPMRTGEKGTPLTFHGQVRAVDGTALGGAVVDIWHCDNDGFYAQFAPGLPEWNLRGRITADEHGNFTIRTVVPAASQIPTGATGALIRAASWHAWRPAHIHLKVSAAGHQLITTELYCPDDPHNDDDIASAVKPELMLDPQSAGDGVDAYVRKGRRTLFAAKMDVAIPADLDAAIRDATIARESL